MFMYLFFSEFVSLMYLNVLFFFVPHIKWLTLSFSNLLCYFPALTECIFSSFGDKTIVELRFL